MKKLYILLFTVVALFNSCSIKFNGASIPPEMKTVTVQFFENNAPLVVPYLSQQFTEDLRTRIRNQSRLSIVQSDGNAIFEGRISNYEIRPVTLTDNGQQNSQTQGSNRLSITVNVKYTNNIDAKQSFEESFTRYKDFVLSGSSLQSLEPQLIKDINAQLTEDIFNRAFAQW
jgi:hypothetical protein